MVRIVKITIYPNFTGNYTIENYKGKYVVNGELNIHSTKLIDKVSKTTQL